VAGSGPRQVAVLPAVAAPVEGTARLVTWDGCLLPCWLHWQQLLEGCPHHCN